MNTLSGNNLISRLLVGVITLTLVIVGFFFLTIALAIGAVVALVFGARLWWTLRKLKKMQASGAVAADAHVVEGDYRIIEHETTVERLPPKL
jgi:uncharacterized membrane protein